MLTIDEKIRALKNCLEDIGSSYADSFKTDMLIYFQDFDPVDPRLNFLHELEFESEIMGWVNRMTSLMVMKLEEKEETVGDFLDWVNR